MPERFEKADETDDVEKARRQSTDLGYRDTEEERAYEEASQPAGTDTGGDDAA